MSDETNTEPDETTTEVQDGLEEVAVQAAQLADISGSEEIGSPMGFDHLLEVPVRVTVQIGCARMSLAELVRLAPGSLVHLDREAHEPADILVNGKVVARGEVVTIDKSYGIRITSVER